MSLPPIYVEVLIFLLMSAATAMEVASGSREAASASREAASASREAASASWYKKWCRLKDKWLCRWPWLSSSSDGVGCSFCYRAKQPGPFGCFGLNTCDALQPSHFDRHAVSNAHRPRLNSKTLWKSAAYAMGCFGLLNCICIGLLRPWVLHGCRRPNGCK